MAGMGLGLSFGTFESRQHCRREALVEVDVITAFCTSNSQKDTPCIQTNDRTKVNILILTPLGHQAVWRYQMKR